MPSVKHFFVNLCKLRSERVLHLRPAVVLAVDLFEGVHHLADGGERFGRFDQRRHDVVGDARNPVSADAGRSPLATAAARATVARLVLSNTTRIPEVHAIDADRRFAAYVCDCNPRPHVTRPNTARIGAPLGATVDHPSCRVRVMV